MSAEVLDIIEEKLNIPIKLIPTSSWSETLKYAKNKECDILPLAPITLSINENMNFTSTYISAPIVIATQKNMPFINNIEDILDKKNLR